eukprot:COSAG01_NODE_110_length_25904_cov_154.158806_5_plen_166_part_00
MEVFVEGCLAIGNLHANVLIADNAVGTLRNNKIIGGETGHVRPQSSSQRAPVWRWVYCHAALSLHAGLRGGWQGILIENNGKATIENNEVCGHAEPNIEVRAFSLCVSASLSLSLCSSSSSSFWPRSCRAHSKRSSQPASRTASRSDGGACASSSTCRCVVVPRL